MPAPPNYVFTIFAFVSFFLCLIRLPMAWHAWNVNIHLFQMWVGLGCLVMGINSIVWNHNTVNWAPVWCDITSRFLIGISIAIPAIILCINRRLYLLASRTSTLGESEADKLREVMIDLAFGIGLPIIVMILYFFAQGFRFQIFEDYGCAPTIVPTWVAVVIINVPPILMELIAGVYGCLSIYGFYKHHSQLMLSSHEDLNWHRYIRLMCLSACDLLTGIPITVFYLCLEFRVLVPFHGLTKEHHHFSQVVQVPASVWRATTIGELDNELNRWLMVFGAFAFFSLFGFTHDACDKYRAVVRFFMTITGIKIGSRRPSNKAEEITFKTPTSTLNHLVDTLNSDRRPSSVSVV